MALSADPRILSGDPIEKAPRTDRQLIAAFRCDFTPGIFVTELQFPDPEVSFVIPRFGYSSFLVMAGGLERWTTPFEVQLSSQCRIFLGEYSRVLAIALIPSPGCRMDAVTRFSQD